MKISNGVKKIIIAAVVVIVAAIACLIFIRKPAFISQFFSQKAVSEPAVVSSGFGGQLFDKVQQNFIEKGLNPYEEAYTNPFE